MFITIKSPLQQFHRRRGPRPLAVKKTQLQSFHTKLLCCPSMPFCPEKQLLHRVLSSKDPKHLHATCDKSLHFLDFNKSERIPPAKCCVMNNYLMSTGCKRGIWESLNGSSERRGKSIRNPHLLQDAVSICLNLQLQRHFLASKLTLTLNSNSKTVIWRTCACNIKRFLTSKTPFSNWQNTVFEGSVF